MKKIIAFIGIMAFAGTAFAGAPDPSVLKGYNPTKNVTVDYDKGASNTTWGASSGHSSGDKNFATTSAYGGIVFKTVTPGAAVSAIAAPATPTDSTIPSGWTSM